VACSVLQCVTVCRRVLLCVAVCCCVLLCVAVCCRGLRSAELVLGCILIVGNFLCGRGLKIREFGGGVDLCTPCF